MNKQTETVSGFTPGPWQTRYETVLPDGTKTASIISPGLLPSFICHCEGENRHANATLIQAAPALFEACKAALNVISEIADIDCENRAGWAHKQLDTALAQAQGKPI